MSRHICSKCGAYQIAPNTQQTCAYDGFCDWERPSRARHLSPFSMVQVQTVRTEWLTAKASVALAKAFSKPTRIEDIEFGPGYEPITPIRIMIGNSRIWPEPPSVKVDFSDVLCFPWPTLERGHLVNIVFAKDVVFRFVATQVK